MQSKGVLRQAVEAGRALENQPLWQVLEIKYTAQMHYHKFRRHRFNVNSVTSFIVLKAVFTNIEKYIQKKNLIHAASVARHSERWQLSSDITWCTLERSVLHATSVTGDLLCHGI